MGPEKVTIRAGGAEWTAFKRCEVHASFEEAARKFTLHIAAEPGPNATAWTFKAGTPIDILFNGDLALSGYVDRYQPRLSFKQADITVSGRSKSQDICDCSALHDTGEFLNKTPLDVANDLSKKFGVKFSTDLQLDKHPITRIVPGETVFRCVEKMCREQGAFLVGQPDGSVKITRAGQERHAGGIVEGVNLLAGNADHDWSGRHSKVIVRGQRALDHGDDNLHIEETAEDSDVSRYRPILVARANCSYAGIQVGSGRTLGSKRG